MKKIVLVTGGFDPIHSGHIDYFKAAKSLGDLLVVGVNSDDWLTRKKGRPFMPITERISIIESLAVVDRCILFDDSDNSAIEAINNVKMLFPNDHIIFANGGDRTAINIPEMAVKGVEFRFGIGGENKKNSSSWILEEWKSPKTIRPWGWYRVLEDKKHYKIKELVIEPGKRLSMQRHQKRAEHWYVLKGVCTIETEYLGSKSIVNISENNTYDIGLHVWHQGQNNTNTPCHILEVQHGEVCVEEDIERK